MTKADNDALAFFAQLANEESLFDEDVAEMEKRNQGLVVNEDTENEGFEPMHGTFFVAGHYYDNNHIHQECLYSNAILEAHGNCFWRLRDKEHVMDWRGDMGVFEVWDWRKMHPDERKKIRDRWHSEKQLVLARAANNVGNLAHKMPEHLRERLHDAAAEIVSVSREFDNLDPRDCMGGSDIE